jgi:hypothetical protein
MLTKATCGDCGQRLPLDCGFLQFRLPPTELTCPRCHARVSAPFAYRSHWTGNQLLRFCLLAGPVIGGIPGLFVSKHVLGAVLVGGLIGLLCGLVAGAVLALVAAPIIQFLIDRFRGVASAVRESRADAEASDDPTPALASSLPRHRRAA